MKNLLFLLLAATLVFSSCGKDDCDDTLLSNVIVGNWDVIALGQNNGSVEFKADGTLIDDEDILVGGEIGGEILDQKSYTVNSNTQFTVTAEGSGGGSLSYDIEVTDFSCDEIDGAIIGIPVTFQRD
jgi:hypothetical protein